MASQTNGTKIDKTVAHTFHFQHNIREFPDESTKL